MKNQTGKISRVLLAVSLSSLLALVTPQISYASDAQSMDKLRTAIALLKLSGEAEDCRSSANGRYLSKGDSYTITTTLYSGNSYTLVAAGDSSVRDLDIILYDENWNEIDKDTQSDALPIVKVSPRWSGTFYIKVKMYRGYGYSNAATCYK